MAIDRRTFIESTIGMASTSLLGSPAIAEETVMNNDWPAIQPLLNSYVASGTLPGLAGSVARGTEPARFFATGSHARDGKAPVTANSLFRIMSMTKPIVGMSVMMLIEDGKMALDQPLPDILPGFANPHVLLRPDSLESRPAKTPITIRHLLTHCSGIGYFSRIEGALRDEYIRLGLIPVRMSANPVPGVPAFTYAPSLKDFADRLATLPLIAEPGTQWNYSMAPDLLGHVIEIVSGMPFDAFVQRRVFDPLGMTSSYWVVPKSEAGRIMTLYGLYPGGSSVLDPGENSILHQPPPFLFGGTGIITSPRDYDRFLLMLAGEGAIGKTRVMKTETARLGMSNLLPAGVLADTNASWSAGFGALGTVTLTQQPDGKGPGTYGWMGGAGTIGFVDRRNGIRAAGYGQWMPERALPFQREYAEAAYKRG